MLKPRRAKSPATRVSTPGLFSTRMESVCFTASSSLCRDWPPIISVIS